MPPYSVAFVFTIAVAVLSERTHQRAPFIAGCSAFGIIGYIILISQKRPGVSYAGTILAAGGIYPATAIMLSWPANNVSGQTKRATANAMQISVGTIGAVVGVQLYRSRWGPRYYIGHSVALGYLAVNISIVCLLRIILKKENARKAAEREAKGLGVLADVGKEGNGFLGDEDPRWVFQL